MRIEARHHAAEKRQRHEVEEKDEKGDRENEGSRSFRDHQHCDRRHPPEPGAACESHQQGDGHDDRSGEQPRIFPIVDPEHEKQERRRQQQTGKRHHVRSRAGDAVLEIPFTEYEVLKKSERCREGAENQQRAKGELSGARHFTKENQRHRKERHLQPERCFGISMDVSRGGQRGKRQRVSIDSRALDT